MFRMNFKNFLLVIILPVALNLSAQKPKTFKISSPDGTIECAVNADTQLTWSVASQQQTIVAPSVISMRLQGGEVLGKNMKVSSVKHTVVNEEIAALMYKKDTVVNNCNQLTITFRGDYGITFRAYNDGVAYRFFTTKKDSVFVQAEEASFVFDGDYPCLFPYANDPRDKKDFFQTSFEALYHEGKLSEQLQNDSMSLLPALVSLANGKKVVITEANLAHYPGMYLGKTANNSLTLNGRFPAYPAEAAMGGYNNINYVVTKRENYIAKQWAKTLFPGAPSLLPQVTKNLQTAIWYINLQTHYALPMYRG